MKAALPFMAHSMTAIAFAFSLAPAMAANVAVDINLGLPRVYAPVPVYVQPEVVYVQPRAVYVQPERVYAEPDGEYWKCKKDKCKLKKEKKRKHHKDDED